MIIKKVMSTPQKSTKITSDIFDIKIIKEINQCIKNHFTKDFPQYSEAAYKYKERLKIAIENVFENNEFINKGQAAQILLLINTGSFKKK